MSVSALPAYLVQRFRAWKATDFAENRVWYRRLAEERQSPRAMVIACCDSRVHVTSVFGADTGEFFIHRNIANLVPPFTTPGDLHGTSAAIEYAVTALRVVHLIVLGHSGCGGIAACHDMCAGLAPELEAETSFVGRWMEILRPAYAGLANPGDKRDARIEELGRAGVLASLDNLMSFPFVAEAVAAERLTLHGAYLGLGDGELEAYDPETGGFVALSAAG